MSVNALKNLFVIAMISGHRVALDATSVASVVDLTNIVPVPLAPTHILGLCTVRSLILTVVDLAGALKLDSENCSKRAVTMEIDGHHYAFIVSSVEQVEASMDPPFPVDNSVGLNWVPVVTGRIETESGSALLLDLRRLVAVSVGCPGVGSIRQRITPDSVHCSPMINSTLITLC